MKYVEMPGGSVNGTGEPTRWTAGAPLINPEPWTAEALCAQADPDAWFPDKGGSVRHVKRICGNCPVREECLDYALRNGEQYGIWGGLSERERRRLLREEAA